MSVSQAVRNPRGYVVRTAGMYRALFFDPERFYEEHLSERGIRSELLLVTVVGLVGLAGNYYGRSQVTTVAQEAGVAIGNDVNFSLWGNAVEPLVGAFLLWVGFSAALFGLSWLYSTVGTFYVTLKNTAWVMVPFFFFNLLHSAALAYSAFTLEESDFEGRNIPRAPEQKTQVIWDTLAGDIFVVATVFIGALLTLWAGYIAVQAVIDVRRLEARDAYKVVAVPFVGFALYLAYQGVTTL